MNMSISSIEQQEKYMEVTLSYGYYIFFLYNLFKLYIIINYNLELIQNFNIKIYGIIY